MKINWIQNMTATNLELKLNLKKIHACVTTSFISYQFINLSGKITFLILYMNFHVCVFDIFIHGLFC